MAIETNELIDVQTLSPFKRFIMTIGNLPTSYLESMTYAELLMWFCNYLQETVIPTVNNNADALAEVQNLMTQLQEYVDNYFTNLDVQEEINNKLDQMVEAGTLQEIIADYLNSKAIFGFDNVQSMKESTNLIDGSYAKTLGYYTKNDGGMATYKIRTITNDDVVNEMNIIALNDNTLIAELINDKNNILCYGVEKNDINNNNHTIINFVLNKMNYAYCKEEIDLHNELILTGENKKFDFFKINYTNQNNSTSAIIIHNTYNYEINGNYLVSNANGVRLGLSGYTSGVQVKIGRITAEKNSIYMGGSDGIAECIVNSYKLDYKEHGIFFDLSNHWIGQIGFYNINFNDQSGEEITENYAVYGNCSSYPLTGVDFYNISLQRAKGGFKFETTSTINFCEHLNVYGCRLAEFSQLNGYKALKLITPTTTNNLLIQGQFNFDSAYIDTFDVSEFYSTQGRSMKLNGLILTHDTSNNDGEKRLCKSAQVGYKTIVVDELYVGYKSYNPSAESTIFPLGYITLLGYTQSYQTPRIYNIKLKNTKLNFQGTYNFRAMGNCTVNILDSSGNVAKTFEMLQGQVLNLVCITPSYSNSLQIQSKIISDTSFNSVT